MIIKMVQFFLLLFNKYLRPLGNSDPFYLLANSYVFSRDAGFVHESFRNETKRTFLTFFSYETNPRNKSYENCVTKQIRETNLLKARRIRIRGSRIRIPGLPIPDSRNESMFLRTSYRIPASLKMHP
jgi:hypothetical protein